MKRTEKAAIVSGLKSRADGASIAIVTDFKGLTVEDMTGLRRLLRDAGVDYQVVKNTLARIALEGGPHEVLKDEVKENCAVAFGYSDPVAAAKVLSEYGKKNKKFQIRFGSLEGQFMDVNAVKDLAKLPSKPELLAKLLGTMNAVPTSFVCLFANLERKFLYALTAIKEQKEAA
ncbi:MAG: 50S ribosomal protein L10 [Proteobacteria bacterium]|nr:50S ribosomal protein L10 [Pseudomonadota bacterium]